jgi:subtilisin family serine protease
MTFWRYQSLLCLILIATLSHAQEKKSKINYKINDEEARKNPHLKYWIIDPSTSKNTADSSNAEVRIIVQLRTSPSTTANSTERARNQAVVSEEHRQFLADINTMQRQNPSGKGDTAPPKVKREYKRALNGFAISTRKHVADRIRQLPNVLHVYEDKKAQAYDLSSNELINVPKVWAETGATGKGITIGIIDTGIDYTHPALGGGMGASFKVQGGYDFVNDDNDPLDDNGHGTHVAGIAAANNEQLKGAAPDAKLYAYKVLSADG